MTILMTPKALRPEVVCLDGSPITNLSLGSLVVLMLDLVVVSGVRLYCSPAFGTNLRSEEDLSEAFIS